MVVHLSAPLSGDLHLERRENGGKIKKAIPV